MKFQSRAAVSTLELTIKNIHHEHNFPFGSPTIIEVNEHVAR